MKSRELEIRIGKLLGNISTAIERNRKRKDRRNFINFCWLRIK